ncbi:MAG: succinate dehydrogenase, cytochrome b556 subunit [Burkholderiaceae bacterium]
MTELDTSPRPARPEFRNIHVFSDLPSYRMPLAALVSILHRVSGALMFVLLPFIIWMFDASVSSEISFARFKHVFNEGWPLSATAMVPGWFMKLVALALIWGYLHHLIAGLRHLWMDASHAAVEKEFGKHTAAATLAVSIGLTIIFGAKLFGLY